MGGASADKAAGHGEAQVGAVAVGGGTGVPAGLPGRVEHQDVHHVVQVSLDQGPVLAACLVGPLNAAVAPVRPVDVVLVLGEAERVRQVVGNHLSLLACKMRNRKNHDETRTRTRPRPGSIGTKKQPVSVHTEHYESKTRQ